MFTVASHRMSIFVLLDANKTTSLDTLKDFLKFISLLGIAEERRYLEVFNRSWCCHRCWWWSLLARCGCYCQLGQHRSRFVDSCCRSSHSSSRLVAAASLATTSLEILLRNDREQVNKQSKNMQLCHTASTQTPKIINQMRNLPPEESGYLPPFLLLTSPI